VIGALIETPTVVIGVIEMIGKIILQTEKTLTEIIPKKNRLNQIILRC